MEIKKTKLANEIWEGIKSLVPIIIIVLFIRTFIAQPFIVSGESMYPTFHDKEYLIVDELSYRLGTPDRGDVVVLRYPLEEKRFFIKRLIGMPGDTITFRAGKVFITEPGQEIRQIDEPYYRGTTIPGNETTVVLQEKEYFVMGDNRNFSSDSRAWGILPEHDLIGRAAVRLLPLSKIDLMPGSLNSFNQ
jgi:signal peptidase I